MRRLDAVDHGGDGRQHGGIARRQMGRGEAALELLGDEVGREPARRGSADAPSAPPGTARCATRRGRRTRRARRRMRSMASIARLAVGAELGDHRVVEHRDLAALVDAGIDAHVGPGRAARDSSPAGRSTAGSCGTDPRHRAAPRPPSRRASRPFCWNGSFSPAATRIISSTRSRPVISSVTGCSTCRRVFISRK